MDLLILQLQKLYLGFLDYNVNLNHLQFLLIYIYNNYTLFIFLDSVICFVSSLGSTKHEIVRYLIYEIFVLNLVQAFNVSYTTLKSLSLDLNLEKVFFNSVIKSTAVRSSIFPNPNLIYHDVVTYCRESPYHN